MQDLSKKECLILNTSNPGKLAEFKRLFSLHGFSLEAQQNDLPEIDADPITVVIHKASQLKDEILVEDTSLEIEEVHCGIHVRWQLENLTQYVGKKATWKTLLAYQKKGNIFVFEGTVNGTIVLPQGKGGFGFDPFFLPENATKTLAETKPDTVNARAKAVEAFIQGKILCIAAPIREWKGPWQ